MGNTVAHTNMKISFKRSKDTLLEKIKPNKTHTNHTISEYLIIF